MIASFPPTLSQILSKFIGTPDGTKFLRDDGSWQTVSAGSVSLSSITSGTLGTTLALGTQVVTSTGDTSWLNATGKKIQMGINGANLLGLGIANNAQGDSRFALGGYGVGAYDGTKAGFASSAATDLTANVASGGVINATINGGASSNCRLLVGSDGTTQGNFNFLIGGMPAAGYAAMYTSGTTLITQALSGSYAVIQVGSGSQQVARFGDNGSVTAFRNFIIGTTNPASGYPYIASDSSNISIASISTTGIIKFILGATEIGRVGPSLVELNRLSLGGTIGSSTDPGAGGLALMGSVNFVAAASGTSSKTQIFSDANAGNLYSNVPTGKYVASQINGTNKLVLGAGLNNVLNGAWAIGQYGVTTSNAAYTGIASDATHVHVNAITGGSIQLRNNDTVKMTVGTNVEIGTAALATGATAGFLNIPSCAGNPSGTPTPTTGLVPMCVDSTNGRLYLYYGGAWHYVVLT